MWAGLWNWVLDEGRGSRLDARGAVEFVVRMKYRGDC